MSDPIYTLVIVRKYSSGTEYRETRTGKPQDLVVPLAFSQQTLLDGTITSYEVSLA